MLQICIPWELVGVDEPALEDSKVVQGRRGYIKEEMTTNTRRMWPSFSGRVQRNA